MSKKDRLVSLLIELALFDIDFVNVNINTLYFLTAIIKLAQNCKIKRYF